MKTGGIFIFEIVSGDVFHFILEWESSERDKVCWLVDRVGRLAWIVWFGGWKWTLNDSSHLFVCIKVNWRDGFSVYYIFYKYLHIRMYFYVYRWIRMVHFVLIIIFAFLPLPFRFFLDFSVFLFFLLFIIILAAAAAKKRHEMMEKRTIACMEYIK